jgi:two-component system, cell cycle sensor histidine kinase and response regulator CckA
MGSSPSRSPIAPLALAQGWELWSHAMRVLLVDDDELVRFAVTEVLSDAGYEVVETGDPHHALSMPETVGPPDVLITDIDLQSELNGFDVAFRAHHLWPKVRIILISGLSTDHTGQSLDPRDRFIQKPFSNDRLLGALEQLANGG